MGSINGVVADILLTVKLKLSEICLPIGFNFFVVNEGNNFSQSKHVFFCSAANYSANRRWKRHDYAMSRLSSLTIKFNEIAIMKENRSSEIKLQQATLASDSERKSYQAGF